jgi:hypothetical protein
VLYWLFVRGESGPADVRAPDAARVAATAAASAPPPPVPPPDDTGTAAPEPARDVWPAEEVGTYDPKAFDVPAWATRATAGARKRWKDVELVVVHAVHVGTDGLSDLTVDERPASYGFRPKGAGPAGEKDDACAFWVVVEATRVYSVADRLRSVCGLPAFKPAPPRCTLPAVLAKLAEKYPPRPGKRTDALTFMHVATTPAGHPRKDPVVTADWSVNGFPTFDDAGAPTGLSIDVADDCAPAK